MVGGQVMDLAAEGNWVDAEHLEKMYALKTGCLIRAAIVMACVIAKPALRSAISMRWIDFRGRLAWRFRSRTICWRSRRALRRLVRSQASDEKNGKATYPALFGLETARARSETLYRRCAGRTRSAGRNAAPLRWLSDFVVRRNH